MNYFTKWRHCTLIFKVAMVIGLIWEKVRPEISQSERAYYLSHTILCISIQQLMVDYKSRVLAIRDSPWLKKAPFFENV